MPAKQTVQQRIEQMVAQHQLWFDAVDSPEQRLHCSFCQESILIDYFQFPYQEMSRRLVQFASKHSGCTPTLATKTREMMLTPKEKKVG